MAVGPSDIAERMADARSSRAEGLHRLMVGAAGLAAGRGIAAALSAVWLAVAARHLSLAAFGDLGVLLATTTVIAIASERGLQTAISIHVATQGAIDARTLRAAIWRRLPLALVGAAINVVLYTAVATDRSIVLPVMAAGTIVGTAVYGTILAGYYSLGHVRAGAANEVFSRLFVLAVGAVWLSRGGGLFAAVACYSLADMASAVVLVAVVFRRHVTRARATLTADLRWRATLPLALIMVVTTVYYRIDTYLVGALRGSQAAALYSASYRFLDLAALLPAAVGSLVLSHTARRAATERLSTIRRLGLLSLAFGLPATLVGVLAGGQLAGLVFGGAYSSAALIVALLLAGAAPTAFVAATIPVVIPASRTSALALVVAALVGNVIVNLVLIPLWSGTGAAVANLATQVLLAIGVFRMAMLQARGERPAAT